MNHSVSSSTPDGLAPLSELGVTVFVLLFSLFAILWAIFNILNLLRTQPLEEEANSSGYYINRLLAVTKMAQKVQRGAFTFLKFNFAVCTLASIIFFLCILGIIESFESFRLSLSYVAGVIFAFLIAGVVATVSSINYNRICSACNESLPQGFDATKQLSNFIGYFTTGGCLLAMYVIAMIVRGNSLESIGQSLLSFSFGVATVAMGSKITTSIYAKGVEGGVPLLNQIEPKLKRDSQHPIMVCKSTGELLSKSVSRTLDYLMLQSLSVAVAVCSGANNIIGVDQKGEIIFEPSQANLNVPFLSLSFAIFFSLIISVTSKFVFQPSTADEIILIFKREAFLVTFLLTGFLALSTYLCLPAQYFLKDCPGELFSPLFPYLIQLIGILVLTLLMIVSELQFNHPRLVYSLINSCRTGAATNLISGLAFGYFSNILPVILLTSLGFLAYFWAGSFGIGLMAVSFAALIPNYLCLNAFFANADNASMIGYINQIGDDPVTNLMSLAENKRVSQPQVETFLVVQTVACCYTLSLLFMTTADIADQIAMTNPTIFSGLLLGAMLGHAFGALLVTSVMKICPVIGYDVRAQLEELPGIADGAAEIDQSRVDYIYSLNAVLQMKYMLPFLLGPFVLFGIGLGPHVMLGAMVGLTISGVQLSLSSGSSGFIWNSVHTEIVLGRAKLEDDSAVQHDSEQGIAAQVGNEVGQRMKDTVGTGLHVYMAYVCLMSTVMCKVYSQIHS